VSLFNKSLQLLLQADHSLRADIRQVFDPTINDVVSLVQVQKEMIEANGKKLDASHPRPASPSSAD
jgi:hypothetical protein